MLSTVHKYAKEMVVKIAPTHFIIIAPQFHTKGRLILYIELQETAIFQEYVMRGVTPDDPENPHLNAIFLELNTKMLLDAFTAAEGSLATVIALASRGLDVEAVDYEPVLRFEFETTTCQGPRWIKHDVNVVIISKNKWCEYDEPSVANVQVNVRLPNAVAFTRTIYKMKWFSTLIRLIGETTGTLAVRGERSGSGSFSIMSEWLTIV